MNDPSLNTSKHSAALFRELAATAQQIRETRGANAKARLFARYISSLQEPGDVDRAARFTGEGAFSEVSGKRASIGSRTISTAAAAFCGIDYEKVFKPCRTATGSSSETIGKLMRNLEVPRQKRTPQDLTLGEVEQYFEKLYAARAREQKEALLKEAWQQMGALEIKYFIRMLGQGSLRIGFETRSIVSALARAYGQKAEDVRYAHMITGSIGHTAVLCKEDRLGEAAFQLFHPVSFMLASPIETRSVGQLDRYLAEEKFDGMRSQIHIKGSQVTLFSRDLNDITRSFPDVAGYFAGRSMPPAVLDGELCVYRDNRIMPFQELQKRMGLKKPGKKTLEQYPVLFISYDLLYWDGQPWFERPLTERREKLAQISRDYGFPVTNQFDIEDHQHLDELFNRALEHGNEGLMLKLKDSSYEYGQRKKSWLKVKRPGGTLDTVLLYAHAGSGKRGGTYSDFTLGVSVKDDDRYDEDFIPIGKAYGGYSDEELRMLNRKIRELAAERYGPTLGLRPELIVEIEFDAIQVNRRTKAKYTLRLPRFRAIRWDLGPGDADTLGEVERLYNEKMEQQRVSQEKNPSFTLNEQGKNYEMNG